MLLDKLIVAVEADIGKLTQGLETAQGTIGGFSERAQSMLDAATAGSAAVAAGLVVAATGFVHMAQAAELSLVADNRIRQIADSMGLFGAETEKVTDRLIALADVEARKLGIDDDVIKATQAKLLTFRELGLSADDVGGHFDRATAAAIDLAAAGFGTAETNATQLGRAMQDPIQGITALRRSGVMFTAEQEEQIRVLVESGRIHEAQAIILGELETQVGGTAEATATASGRMRVAFNEMVEEIGAKLLPAFDSISATIVDEVIPAVETFVADAVAALDDLDANTITIIAGALLGALVPAAVAATVAMWGMVAPLIPFIAAGAVLGVLVDALVGKLGGWGVVLDTAQAAFGALVDGIMGRGTEATGPIADIYDAGVLLRDGFDLAVVAVTAALDALESIVAWAVENEDWLGPITAGVAGMSAAVWAWITAIKVKIALLGAWKTMLGLAAAVQTKLNIAMAANPIGLIIVAVAGLVAALVYLWTTNEGFRSAVTAAWNGLKAVAATVWGAITTAFNSGVAFFRDLPTTIGTALSGLWAAVRAPFDTAVKNLRNMGKDFLQAGKDLIQSVIDGITGKIEDVRRAASRVASTIRNFLPFSPAKVGPLADLHKVGDGFYEELKRGFAGVNVRIPAIIDPIAGGLYGGLTSPSLAGGGFAGGTVNQTVHVSFEGIQIASDYDVERMAERLDRLLTQRRRAAGTI